VSTIATRLGWIGWLLVLVYFGAQTAISDYIAHWFLFSEELLFCEVFVTVILSTVILYVLAQVHSTLGDKNSTSKWWSKGLKSLSMVFGVIRFVYWVLGLFYTFQLKILEAILTLRLSILNCKILLFRILIVLGPF
jgi:hypothetical protein